MLSMLVSKGQQIGVHSEFFFCFFLVFKATKYLYDFCVVLRRRQRRSHLVVTS